MGEEPCGPLMCVFLPARGPVFSSGHDLKELTSAQGRDYHAKVFHTCTEVRRRKNKRTEAKINNAEN